ncbi:MAG: hypothetical protein RI883_1617 [Bacteroidota bacterium]
MSLIQFFGSGNGEIPGELSVRTETFTILLLGVLLISFLLISLSRLYNTKSLKTVIAIFFKNSSVEQELKENMSLSSLSSFLLILNYFISFSLCCFLYLNRFLLMENFWATIIAVIIPISLFIIETLGLIMIAWITGEQKQLFPAIVITLTGNQFVGIAFSLLSLLWIMNPEFNKLFLSIFLGLFLLKYFMRLFKNSFIVLSNGVSWYYLILYFCTLEILPLFIIYYYVEMNFQL